MTKYDGIKLIGEDQIKKHSFLIEGKDGELMLISQIGETREEVKLYVERNLNSHWSLVEDLNIISKFINNEPERTIFNESTDWFYELLDDLHNWYISQLEPESHIINNLFLLENSYEQKCFTSDVVIKSSLNIQILSIRNYLGFDDNFLNLKILW